MENTQSSPAVREVLPAAFILAMGGWIGLFWLVDAARPTIGPRWLFFFLSVLAICGTALPFVAYAAVCGFTVWESENPLPRIKPASSLFAMTLLASLAILINQAMDSPSHSLYRAALFLERYDPKGPFRIEAPGRARTQMQAYVSGCPRFTVEAGDTATMGLRPPPGWSGHPQRDARSWIDYLRVMLELRGASTDWYGGGTKVYVFTVDGKGTIPPKGKLLFKDGSVELYERP